MNVADHDLQVFKNQTEAEMYQMALLILNKANKQLRWCLSAPGPFFEADYKYYKEVQVAALGLVQTIAGRFPEQQEFD